MALVNKKGGLPSIDTHRMMKLNVPIQSFSTRKARSFSKSTHMARRLDRCQVKRVNRFDSPARRWTN